MNKYRKTECSELLSLMSLVPSYVATVVADRRPPLQPNIFVRSDGFPVAVLRSLGIMWKTIPPKGLARNLAGLALAVQRFRAGLPTV